MSVIKNIHVHIHCARKIERLSKVLRFQHEVYVLAPKVYFILFPTKFHGFYSYSCIVHMMSTTKRTSKRAAMQVSGRVKLSVCVCAYLHECD